MAPSSFTPNERLLRKRLAARLRQRRCRQRKREQNVAGVTVESKDAASIQGEDASSSTKSTPTSSPSKGTPVYVDMGLHHQQQMKQPHGGYRWPYPAMPLPPRIQGMPLPPHAGGYYAHHPPMMPMMYPHYAPHPFARGAPCTTSYRPPQHQPTYQHQPTNQHQPTYPDQTSTKLALEPEDVSRTVSRSPSDESMNSGKAANAAVQEEQQQLEREDEAFLSKTASPAKKSAANKAPAKKAIKGKKHPKKSLMSTEKAAVVAMLSMKSSSDESDGETVSEHQLEMRPVALQITSV